MSGVYGMYGCGGKCSLFLWLGNLNVRENIVEAGIDGRIT
jgi:hypothetical protein